MAACLVFVTIVDLSLTGLAQQWNFIFISCAATSSFPVFSKRPFFPTSLEHLKIQLNRRITFTVILTECYLFHRIILQKQLQHYEAISTSLGTGAMWMKMAISGLLQEQMISYCPLGNFSSVYMSTLTDHWCSGVNLLLTFICFISQLQNWTIWGGKCPGWASCSCRGCCCQQPRPHQGGGKKKKKIHLHFIICWQSTFHTFQQFTETEFPKWLT